MPHTATDGATAAGPRLGPGVDAKAALREIPTEELASEEITRFGLHDAVTEDLALKSLEDADEADPERSEARLGDNT